MLKQTTNKVVCFLLCTFTQFSIKMGFERWSYTMRKTLTVLYCLFFALSTIGFLQSFDLYGLVIWLLMAWLVYYLVKKAFLLPKSNTKNIQTQSTNAQQSQSTLSPIELRIHQLTESNPALSEEEIKEVILNEEKEKILNQALGNFKIEVTRSSYTPETRIQETVTTQEYDLTYTKVRKLTPDFVVLDFETTGLSHFNDEIIQVAAVRYINFEEKDKFVTFVKPSNSIPSRITEITGITNNDVKNSPSINSVLPTLLEFIERDVIVAHNASFDMKFLLTNIQKENIEYRKFKVIDTLSLARKYIDSTKNHKLPTLKSFLRLNHLNSHEALHDCYVAAELYKYCYEESFINK